jgi:hypothetical protein
MLPRNSLKSSFFGLSLEMSDEPAEKAYTKSFFHRKNLQLAKSCCTFADGEQ